MKKDEYQLIINKLEQLHKQHSSYTFGNIISMAFSEYGDIWGLTNREALYALQKYQSELELDGNDRIASPAYIEKLYKDVENFDNILDEEEEEED